MGKTKMYTKRHLRRAQAAKAVKDTEAAEFDKRLEKQLRDGIRFDRMLSGVGAEN